jgi:hypothetical protein
MGGIPVREAATLFPRADAIREALNAMPASDLTVA